MCGEGGEEPLRDSQHKAGCARSQFQCQLNEDNHLKIIFHNVTFLQYTLYTCEVQSIGNLGGGDSVVKFRY